MLNFFQSTSQKQILTLDSKILNRTVTLETIQAKPAFSFSPAALLLINDGQDFPALEMEKTLVHLLQQKQLPHLLVVGIHSGDRMQEYGTAIQADYAGRGAQAKAYSLFILGELLPFLYQHFNISVAAKDHAFAGFSLGGLSALDIVWNHPEVFHTAGVFSGSLWWSSTPFDPKNPDADRIMHTQIARGEKRDHLSFWLQAGTHDEEGDRNNNGVIDAIDDTLDLITELEKIGYQNEKDITYVEVDKGEHNPETWRKVMPDFLTWWLRKRK